VTRRPLTASLAALLALACSLPAGAAAKKTSWSLRGAGWGHGIGMSQYGAYGYAKRGTGYRAILSHYYSGTGLDHRSGQTVRVLLQPNQSRVSFRGATKAGGRDLNAGSTYRARRAGSHVVLRSASGRRLATARGALRVTGSRPLRLLGGADNGLSSGTYRGALEIRTAGGSGLNAINAVDLEDYVKGVVPNESPASWPAAALQAQAVAARSYALASGAGGRGFNQYADTRSQVYRGASSETRATNSATARTGGQVVAYKGKTAVTYFFSTSGGHTENVENVFLGSDPKPWLKGVDDPYDNTSPYHDWGPYNYSTGSLTDKLGGLVKGSFRGLEVIKHGTSPRIVKARILGSRGNTIVTGPQLRARLGLRDTWFSIRKH
jgi:stage II sporulation protein D